MNEKTINTYNNEFVSNQVFFIFEFTFVNNFKTVNFRCEEKAE